ncbi:MAG: response regulator [Thermoanaerobaculia bacterium]|jgi:DNA-binding response OmpR family regulator
METTTSASAVLPRRTILLVDDSATTLMVQRMILRTGPYDLIVARDGREAIELATSRFPDLVLLDVVMPGMSGVEVCAELRSLESTRATPIIMVTTRGDRRCVEQAAGAGCSDYITKPIDGIELLNKVRAALRGRCDRNTTTETL